MNNILEKKIEEGNKLIAEFMQLKVLGAGKYINPVMASSTTRLAYHENWGWLMPVVEKISNYHYPDYFPPSYPEEERNLYEDCAYMRTFGMRDGDGKYMVRINANTLFHADTLIEATWDAVIDFIEWYNKTTHNEADRT